MTREPKGWLNFQGELSQAPAGSHRKPDPVDWGKDQAVRTVRYKAKAF